MQQSLLKILEGEKLFVPMNVTAHWNKHDYVEIDISNILFICAGSFSEMEEEPDGRSVGFFENAAAAAREISAEDLVKYGFLPELLGRLPLRVELQHLRRADLVSILTEPREAMIPEYQRLCALDQIQLEFTPRRALRDRQRRPQAAPRRTRAARHPGEGAAPDPLRRPGARRRADRRRGR